MPPKRQRSSNYTSQEVAKLLELVEQHGTAVEDKRSGAIYLTRKKEAWEKIRIAYNSVATSGIRTIDQLRVLYDNKKQKARKALAEHNKSAYIKQTLLSHNVSETEFKDAIRHAKDDKGECSKTGGGSWCPTVSETDQKILDLLKEQVTPLPNEYDSAASFFGDVTNTVDVQPLAANNTIVIDNIDIETKTHENITSDMNNEDTSSKIVKNNKENYKFLPIKQRVTRRQSKFPKNKMGVNYKQLYFKRKCQNAYLDRRRIYQEIRLRQKEHNLLLKEHQIRIKHMEEEQELRMQQNH